MIVYGFNSVRNINEWALNMEENFLYNYIIYKHLN